MHHSRSLLILVACAACLPLAACGGSDGDDGDDAKDSAVVILDTKRVERAIEDSIKSARDITADVDCPSGVHQGKGLTFLCTAKTQDGTTTFEVQQKDDKGRVEYAAR